MTGRMFWIVFIWFTRVNMIFRYVYYGLLVILYCNIYQLLHAPAVRIYKMLNIKFNVSLKRLIILVKKSVLHLMHSSPRIARCFIKV